MEFELKNQGLILDKNTINESDFAFSGDSELLEKLKNTKNINTKSYKYDQSRQSYTRNACVLYSACGCVSDLTGYKFSNAELIEITQLAEKEYGWEENYGMYLYKGIDCVRNYWNKKFPEKKLVSYRVEIGSEEFELALKNGFSIQVGYLTSKDYYNDSQDNGILEGEDFGSLKGGHAVRKHGNYIVDNYAGKKKYNEYIIDHIDELKENGIYFKWAYLFLEDQDNILNYKKKIMENIKLNDAKKFVERGLTNGLDPNKEVVRQENWAFNERTIEYLEEKFNKKLEEKFDTLQKMIELITKK